MAEFTEVLKQRERMCKSYDSVSCLNCNLHNSKNDFRECCDSFIFNHPAEAEKIITDWAKENPIKTNADKFKEVFGIDIATSPTSRNCNGLSCPDTTGCVKCKYNGFWDREYVPPTK